MVCGGLVQTEQSRDEPGLLHLDLTLVEYRLVSGQDMFGAARTTEEEHEYRSGSWFY